PSRIVDPGAFRWSDDAWRGVELGGLVFYELHVGTFSGAGSFDGVLERLGDLASLGITAIELMPVAEFPGTRNWGYDGVHPYAPHDAYGGPEGLKRLVDAAHRAGLAVVLDVVYNHLGPEGNYLAEFGPYFTDRYATPWGDAVNFDGADSDEVRRYFLDNALYWVSEFHLDGLRLDAVHAIYDFSARHILEEIADAVHALAACLGRNLHVIAESDLNDPRLVRPREQGGFALDAQWNDDFHHAVHTALTGERIGYYADFAGIDPVAKVLKDRFALDGRYSRFRRRRHGREARDLSPARFVVFTQNHDHVGNRPRGERLASLVPFEKQKLAAALLLISPYLPLVFMGEEYAESRPFLYFVSHGDPD
ncbi:MAG: malto-oligosyltrehalose trehalohydrolase, partial [Candidatus Binatia bacterium]